MAGGTGVRRKIRPVAMTGLRLATFPAPVLAGPDQLFWITGLLDHEPDRVTESPLKRRRH